MKSDSPIQVHSSEEFAKGPFKPHGRVHMWLEGATVYGVAQGPFNQEFVAATALARNELLKVSPPPEKHAHLLQVQVSMMASPEMLTVFAQFAAHMKSPPVVTAWVVAPDVEGRDFLLPMFERIFRTVGRNFRAFETLAEAEAWVRPFIASHE